MTTVEGSIAASGAERAVGIAELCRDPVGLQDEALLAPTVAAEIHRMHFYLPQPHTAYDIIATRLKDPQQHGDDKQAQESFKRLNERYLGHQAFVAQNNGRLRRRSGGSTQAALEQFVSHELLVANIARRLLSGAWDVPGLDEWLHAQANLSKRDRLQILGSASEKIDYAPVHDQAGTIKRELWMLRQKRKVQSFKPETSTHVAADSPAEQPSVATVPQAEPTRSGLAEVVRTGQYTGLFGRFALAGMAFVHGHEPPEKVVATSTREALRKARDAARIIKITHAHLGMSPDRVEAVVTSPVFRPTAERITGSLEEAA